MDDDKDKVSPSKELKLMDAYWRACNYLSVGMIYLKVIHKLAYRFKGHDNLHVRGYKEKGNINTPLELAMLNETSRFHLVIDVIDRVPKLRTKGAHLKEQMKDAILDNMRYAHEHGTDRPELANWTWPH